jgi:hypothetical protein
MFVAGGGGKFERIFLVASDSAVRPPRAGWWPGILRLFYPNRQIGEVAHTVLHDAIINGLIASFMRATAKVVVFFLTAQIHDPFPCQLLCGLSPLNRFLSDTPRQAR